MENLRIAKMMSVFSKHSMLVCMIAVGIISLVSCDKHSMEGIDLSSIEQSRPPTLKNTPPPIISDMEVLVGMTLNGQNRVDKFLQNMTPEKLMSINNFKNANLFNQLPQNEQLVLISEVLGFDNVQEYLKYAKFLDTKIQSVNKWAKDNNVSSEKIVNQVRFISEGITTNKNSSARLQSENIPQEWLDFETYVANQGPGNQRCGEYDRCMKDKVGELLAGSFGASAVGAWVGGPAGAGIAFLGGLVGGGFTVIYSGAWGECSRKREQCKDTHHPSVNPSNPNDGEEKLPCPNCPPHTGPRFGGRWWWN